VLLVDGYNLLFALKKPDSRTLERDRNDLVKSLESFAERTNQTMRIVFDRGGPRRERRARVEVVYVADGSTADDVIVAALEESSDRTAYRVVSSDRAIRKAAEKRRFEVVEVREFWRDVQSWLATPEGGEPASKERGISAGEADAWMKEFGFGGNDDEARGSR
jgi:predicted RNA-binding protein with PIN domain